MTPASERFSAAKRKRPRAGFASEARRLMRDPAYVREAREVAAQMQVLRSR